MSDDSLFIDEGLFPPPMEEGRAEDLYLKTTLINSDIEKLDSLIDEARSGDHDSLMKLLDCISSIKKNIDSCNLGLLVSDLDNPDQLLLELNDQE